MSSPIPPLDKLYKLQFLNIMDYFDKNQDFLKSKHYESTGKTLNIVLTMDENINGLTFIILQSMIPDLAS